MMHLTKVFLLLGLTLFVKNSMADDITSTPNIYKVINNIPPRSQWLGNNGYCGETSFVSAALYYGQYVSQYTVRGFANNNLDNQTQDLLVDGKSDANAAVAMHLNYEEYARKKPSASAFLLWVKQNVVKGFPVIIGIYMNKSMFDGNSAGGDSEYDHIVLVKGVMSFHGKMSGRPIMNTKNYYPDDSFIFSDNGLWTGGIADEPFYDYVYPAQSFIKNRQQANDQNIQTQSIYSLPANVPNYGIVITGIRDDDKETLPVQVSTNLNYEYPEILDTSITRPTSMPLTLTITVKNLTPGVAYKLYKYQDFKDVPNSHFNSSGTPQTVNEFTATNSKYVTVETINSNENAIYRAVRADAL